MGAAWPFGRTEPRKFFRIIVCVGGGPAGGRGAVPRRPGKGPGWAAGGLGPRAPLVFRIRLSTIGLLDTAARLHLDFLRFREGPQGGNEEHARHAACIIWATSLAPE